MSNDLIVNFAFLVAANWHSCNTKKKIVKSDNISYQLMHTPLCTLPATHGTVTHWAQVGPINLQCLLISSIKVKKKHSFSLAFSLKSVVACNIASQGSIFKEGKTVTLLR